MYEPRQTTQVVAPGVPGRPVALITGAGSGIGAATATILGRRGARVVLVGRTADDLEAVAAGLADPEQVLTQVADVRDYPAMERVVSAAVARFGRLDAVIAAAGIGSFAPLLATPPDVLREVVETNLLGSIHTARAVAEALLQTGGRMVLVGSAAGRRGVPGLAAYSASKAGLYGLADALRVELGPGVRVSVVAPGATRTRFFARAFGEPGAARGAAAEVSAALVVRALDHGPATLDDRFLARGRAALNALFPSCADRWVRWRSRA